MLDLLQNFQLSDVKSWLAEMLNTLSHSQRTRVVVIFLGNLACEEESYSRGDLSKPVINQISLHRRTCINAVGTTKGQGCAGDGEPQTSVVDTSRGDDED
jgi:hypothetical protein